MPAVLPSSCSRLQITTVLQSSMRGTRHDIDLRLLMLQHCLASLLTDAATKSTRQGSAWASPLGSSTRTMGEAAQPPASPMAAGGMQADHPRHGAGDVPADQVKPDTLWTATGPSRSAVGKDCSLRWSPSSLSRRAAACPHRRIARGRALRPRSDDDGGSGSCLWVRCDIHIKANCMLAVDVHRNTQHVTGWGPYGRICS